MVPILCAVALVLAQGAGLRAESGATTAPANSALEWIKVSRNKHGFVCASSGRPFIPWGFNYDRDYKCRLLEDYWEAEWPTVVEDFREMKQLGANVVRVHLQFARFMDAPDRPNEKSLERLGRLVKLAEETGLYLDLTGLGCYRKKDVPAWYSVHGRDRALGGPGALLGGSRRALRRQPGHLLLRPDERAHRARREASARRLAHRRTGRVQSIASSSRWIRLAARGRRSRASGSPSSSPPSASTTGGT